MSFCKLRKLESPYYLFAEIPPIRPVLHNLKHSCTYTHSPPRNVRFSNTYFYNTLFEWNSLNDELKNSSTLTAFKRKLIARVRPEGNHIYGIPNLHGIRLLTLILPGGVFHPLLVFCSLVIDSESYVPPTTLTFTNHLLATFSR